MLRTLAILNDMVREGAIENYALCGAMAAFRYIEPAATRDMDVSVEISGVSPLLLNFDSVIAFLQRRGLPIEWDEEGIEIYGVPVQFIPVATPLDREGLDAAQTVTEGDVSFKVWRVEHLMAKCIQVARPKDKLRLMQFLNTDFDKSIFCKLLDAHALREKWLKICEQLDVEDVCGRP